MSLKDKYTDDEILRICKVLHEKKCSVSEAARYFKRSAKGIQEALWRRDIKVRDVRENGYQGPTANIPLVVTHCDYM